MTQHADRWSLVVPVKRVENAKTRLGLDAESRASLAVAMAVDTVAAALACPLVAGVVVVTDDSRARRALAELDVRIVADEPDAGLNAALEHGVALVAGGHVGALASDLPSLRSEDLGVVLSRAERHVQAVVGDLSGTGTTLLCARSAADFAPHFGVESLAAHVAAGATDLTELAPESLRRDVDTVDGLSGAVDLGVGAATQRALANLPVAEGL
ncbi:MAG TPA: 2-phospho-L-lactate guanylyltransferase [Mycobacteriales bacterium]|nr:2-phospho-L-lactate guanylyltransferase [Mycobacteriales bacterium]